MLSAQDRLAGQERYQRGRHAHRDRGRGALVEALDPRVMVTWTGRPDLKPVADEAGRRLARALAALTS